MTHQGSACPEDAVQEPLEAGSSPYEEGLNEDIEASADATTEDPPNTGDGVVEPVEDPEEFLPADSSRPEERPFESDEPGAAAATEGSRAAGDDATGSDTDAPGTAVPGDDQGEGSAAGGARAVVRCHFCGRPIFPP